MDKAVDHEGVQGQLPCGKLEAMGNYFRNYIVGILKSLDQVPEGELNNIRNRLIKKYPLV